jgi:hypothetical protein
MTEMSLAKNETKARIGRPQPHLTKPYMKVSPATTTTTMVKVLPEKLVGVCVGTPTTLVFKDGFSSVILGPELLITQHFIGFTDILEFLFGFFFVISVLIRMPYCTSERVVVSSVANQFVQKV